MCAEFILFAAKRKKKHTQIEERKWMEKNIRKNRMNKWIRTADPMIRCQVFLYSRNFASEKKRKKN